MTGCEEGLEVCCAGGEEVDGRCGWLESHVVLRTGGDFRMWRWNRE